MTVPDRRLLALCQRWLNGSGEDTTMQAQELLERLRLMLNTLSASGLADFAVTPTFNGSSPIVNPLLSNLLFSPDNTLDIGASGATRARDLFLGRNAVIGGTLGVTGDATLSGLLKTGSGPVTLTNAAGKLLALSAALFASLDGNALTNLAADQLGTGTAPTARLGSGTASVETFLRGDQTWGTGFAQVCQGRLTLTTGLPVTIADVTAAGTIFFTPYGGNRIAVYNGTNWKLFSFSELSLGLTATSGKPYDVFVFDNAGVLTLETLVWTNDTTRATALVLQDGVLVKSGATTRRYLGSFYTSGANVTEDSFAKRYVWNYYNRVPRMMRVMEATDSWNYTLATYRQANGSTANQLDFMLGVAEEGLEANLSAQAASNQVAASVGMLVGIGLDSTTTITTGTLMSVNRNILANLEQALFAALKVYPAAGRHFAAWLEASTAVGTTTWYGDQGGPSSIQSGIHGVIRG